MWKFVWVTIAAENLHNLLAAWVREIILFIAFVNLWENFCLTRRGGLRLQMGLRAMPWGLWSFKGPLSISGQFRKSPNTRKIAFAQGQDALLLPSHAFHAESNWYTRVTLVCKSKTPHNDIKLGFFFSVYFVSSSLQQAGLWLRMWKRVANTGV